MKKYILFLFLSLPTMAMSLPLSITQLLPEFLYKEQKKIQQAIRPNVAIIEYIDPLIDWYQVADDIYKATIDSSVSAILMLVNSYGGSGGSFELISDMLKKASKEKPVVAFLLTEALSGGYLAASGADYIIASRGCEVGSIGVWMTCERLKNIKYHDEHAEGDLEVEIIKAGEFKTATNLYAPSLSEREKNYIQNYIANLYDEFKKIVAENRSLELQDADKWAEGKVFLAQEALELRLIDQIGTFFEVEQKIIELLKKKNPHILYDSHINKIHMR